MLLAFGPKGNSMLTKTVAALTAVAALTGQAPEIPAPARSVQLKVVQESVELAADTTYEAGQRLKSTAIGVSFVVPPHCTARIHAESWNVTFKSKSDSVVACLVLQTGLDAALSELNLNSSVDFGFLDSSVSVKPAAKARSEGNRSFAEYEGDGAGFGFALRGSKGNGLACIAAATKADKESASKFAQALEKSVQMEDPQSAQALLLWKAQVLGQHLTAVDEASRLTLDLHLLKDSSYYMKANVGGQSQEQTGTWRVELGLMGSLLVLTRQEGVATLRLALAGTDLRLEGLPVTKRASSLKSAGERPAEPARPEPAPEEKPQPEFRSDIREVAKLDGQDCAFDTQYAAGTRLKVELLGISLKIPEGCIGGATASVNYFIYRPTDQQGVGLVMAQTGVNSIQDAAALLAGKPDLSSLEEGLVMDPDGAPKIEGSRASMRYTSAAYVAYSVALVGPSKNGVIVSFIAPRQAEAKAKSFVQSVADSLQFAKPNDSEMRKQWNEGLKGYCLHYFNYRSSKGNQPGNWWDSTTNIWMHFGSDNTYRWIYKYESSGGVKNSDVIGGTASDDNKTEDGTWRIEFTLTGTLLYLTNDKGELSVVLLQFDGKKITANGKEVSRSQSDIKR